MAVWGGARAALLAALAAVLVGAGPAYAHTDLVSTDPVEGAVLDRSPGQVRLTFNETVRLAGDSVQVYDAAGNLIEATTHAREEVVQVDLSEELGDGSYVVSWRVVALDGHPLFGELSFAVGAASPVVADPRGGTSNGVKSFLSAVQGVTYLALFLAFGLAMFWFVVLGSRDAESHARILLVAGPAAAVGVLGALLQLPLGAMYQQGQGLSALFDVGGWWSAIGRDEWVAAVLVVVGLLLGAEYLRGRNAVGSLAGFFLAVVGLALVGHTRAYGPTWLVMVADVLHVVAGAAWLGGLIALVLVLPRLAARESAEVLARFSTAAAGLVALVAATGSIMAWRILGSWDGLVDSPFGRLLVVKVAIVLVVLAVAAMNRFWLLPRLVRVGGQADLLRRTVRLEAAGLVAVLLLAGFLVEQSPKPDEATTVRSVAVPGDAP